MTLRADAGLPHVTSLYEQLLEAWNRQDAAAFAELFGEHGSCIGFDGSQMNGRHEIAATLGDIFRHHKTAHYVANVREVRDLAPEVTVLRAVVGMVPPGQSALNPAVNAVQSLVAVNLDGDLRIALLQNTPAAFHGRPELAQQLTAELTDVLNTGRTVVDNSRR